MFTAFARSTALGNAVLLLHGYVSLANATADFVPAEFTWAFGGDAGLVGLVMFVKSWGQAQLCVQSLAAIHRRLVRIANADH